jgi:hypothetical protein
MAPLSGQLFCGGLPKSIFLYILNLACTYESFYSKALFPLKFSMNQMGPKESPSLPDDSGGPIAFFGCRKISIQKKARSVFKYFDAIASKYNLMNTILSFGLHYLWKKWAVHALRLQPGEWVLDVCGGTADLSILAGRSMGPEGRVILLDINRAMIEGGIPKVAAASLKRRIQFVQGDAELLFSRRASLKQLWWALGFAIWPIWKKA